MPSSGVTVAGESCTDSWEDVAPPSSLIWTHAPIPFGSPLLRHLPRSRSLCRLLPAPAAHGIFPTLSLRIFPRMLGPLPRRVHGVHLPVSSPVSSAFPNRGNESADPRQPANTIFRGAFFEVANISLCSGLRVCSSPRSFLPLLTCRRAAETFTSGLNVLRCLRTHRTC